MPSAHYPPAAPALCQPGGLPYVAPYCPPMQCIHPPVEEDPIGAAWTEPIPARALVVASAETEPPTGPMTELGRLTRDQPNWREPAQKRASSATDVSASSRPLHSIRSKSNSSTSSSTDSEDAAPQSANQATGLAAQFKGETQANGPTMSASMRSSSSTSGRPPNPKQGTMQGRINGWCLRRATCSASASTPTRRDGNATKG